MLATSINKELLLKVMKVADIYEFTITNAASKPVNLVSIDGTKYRLSKEELTANFTTLQGKPIRVIRMSKNKQYLAARLQSTPCFAVKIPKNSSKSIKMPDGQVVGPGKVIVVHQNQIAVNGDTVDISKGTIMTEAFFRKTCVLKEISDTLNKQLITSGVLKDENIKTTNPVPQPAQQPTQQPTQSVQQPTQPVQQPTQQPVQSNSLGNVIEVCKYMGTNIVAGYKISINGEIMMLDVDRTMQACDEGLLGNITTVTNYTTGKKYLRGVGIKLEELPVSYV